MLKRVFVGWLRGERGHCSMVAIPTLDEEDAKRPGREREGLVRERTRIINRMKAAVVRLGIRDFKPELRSSPARIEILRTPENVPLHPILWPRSAATSRASVYFESRSRRSSRSGTKPSNENRIKRLTRCCGYWPELSALVSRVLICWSAKSWFAPEGPKSRRALRRVDGCTR